VQYFYHRHPEDGTHSKHYTYFSIWIALIIIGPIVSAPQNTTALLVCVIIPHIILLTVGIIPILLTHDKTVSKAAVSLHIFLYIGFIILQALEIPLGEVFPLRLVQMLLLFFATEIFYLNKRDKCENRTNKKVKKIVLHCSAEEKVVEKQCSIRVIERTMRGKEWRSQNKVHSPLPAIHESEEYVSRAQSYMELSSFGHRVTMLKSRSNTMSM